VARPRTSTSTSTSSSHAFKQLSVGELVALDTIKPEPKVRPETPRQRAIRERTDDIRAACNIAAAAPASLAVPIKLKPGQKLATLRLAVAKLMEAEKRDLHWGVRGETIYISKGQIPGGRGRRRKTI
jgi:hypothetical protein